MRIRIWLSILSVCSSFLVKQSLPSIRGLVMLAQPEDFTAGPIRPARPFRIPSPRVADEKTVETESKRSVTPLRSKVEMENEEKQKLAEALELKLEETEKRNVQKKEIDPREKEEASLREVARRSAADTNVDEKRLIAEQKETSKIEKIARKTEKEGVKTDADENAATSSAQKDKEEAAQLKAEKAQKEVDEFRINANKNLEQARLQAQEYADSARVERQKAQDETMQFQVEQSSREKNEIEATRKTKEEEEEEDARREKENNAAAEAKRQKEAQVSDKGQLMMKQDEMDEMIKPLNAVQRDTQEKEMLDLPSPLNGAIHPSPAEDTEVASSVSTSMSIPAAGPTTAPLTASAIGRVSSELGSAILPFAAILGGAVFLRNNRIQKELDVQVELRGVAKERIEELEQEEKTRFQVLFWASILSALVIGALQL